MVQSHMPITFDMSVAKLLGKFAYKKLKYRVFNAFDTYQ